MEDHATPQTAESVSPVAQEVKHELPLDTERDDAPKDASINYVTGWKLVVVVAGVALACFLMLIDTMIISTVSPLYRHAALRTDCVSFIFSLQAIPRITDDFNSLADIGWYASAYQFGRYI
jgi:hypothetical protein